MDHFDLDQLFPPDPEDDLPLQPSPTGIPRGWQAREKDELRSDPWRFFYIFTDDEFESVTEDNWVIKGDQAMIEVEGLTQFISDHSLHENAWAIPPERFANQVGVFLIRGDSRRGCGFTILTYLPEYPQHANKLHIPESHVEDGVFIHRAWYKRNGGRSLNRIVVTMPSGGPAQVDDEEWIYDALYPDVME